MSCEDRSDRDGEGAVSQDGHARFIWHSFYSDIARRSLIEVEQLYARWSSLRLAEPESEEAYYEQLEVLRPISTSVDEKGVLAIVFAAMALEAYIYDYGARKLGASLVDKHLDRLSLLDKWVTYPLFAVGKPLPKDRQGFQLLRDLITARNSLVHARSKPCVLSELPDRFEEQNKADLVENARLAIKAIDAVAKDLQSVDPDEPAARHLGSPSASDGRSD